MSLLLLSGSVWYSMKGHWVPPNFSLFHKKMENNIALFFTVTLKILSSCSSLVSGIFRCMSILSLSSSTIWTFSSRWASYWMTCARIFMTVWHIAIFPISIRVAHLHSTCWTSLPRPPTIPPSLPWTFPLLQLAQSFPHPGHQFPWIADPFLHLWGGHSPPVPLTTLPLPLTV